MGFIMGLWSVCGHYNLAFTCLICLDELNIAIELFDCASVGEAIKFL